MEIKREVLVRDLFRFFYLQLIILIVLWLAFAIIAIFELIPIKTIYLLLITMALTYFPLRFFIIGCVLMYKAYAPLETRDKCRFIPTCSSYMIMAVNKYGIVIGLIKGIRRILRCKPPNGGIDYP